jgi:uncharacterized phage protein (TIGR01671 family)
MNRIIKFRGWNKAVNQMVDLKKITPFALSHDINGLFLPFDENVILMQFTGLVDKTGKDIYEGDIVKGGGFNRLIVKWDYSSWGLFDAICREFTLTDDVIIVGNVFELEE